MPAKRTQPEGRFRTIELENYRPSLVATALSESKRPPVWAWDTTDVDAARDPTFKAGEIRYEEWYKLTR
ncbi:hypothetical protein GWI33_007233 [Rhynchophorus ferrugineus]|uniref:Uncharacterized protein n=1 Tax=Rhynchophorus ferrugineus TaxID=354439 RepID=A0A834IEP9_RHYFE|nr:hypothetical protein GWI33_007233 [Rhynchophorus ferrugineus]